MCGRQPGVKIIPFRGDYYELSPKRSSLVRNLIYPVPDPQFPFLGVHFTRIIHGGVEAGPNAVLALAREGYRKSSFSSTDTRDLLMYGGFWKLALRHWQMGLGEIYRSLSKRAFVAALQKLVPELHLEDVSASGAGVRAQAVKPNGQLVDDFYIEQDNRMIHVLNAPSPAATAPSRRRGPTAVPTGAPSRVPKGFRLAKKVIFGAAPPPSPLAEFCSLAEFLPIG